MPTLFDLCQDTEPLKKLQKISADEKKRQYDEIVRRHRETHIFDSYEQALDYLVQHPGKRISWHVKTLQYLPDENLFLSHEQEYSFDGVIPYNVTKKYTREELLSGVYDTIKERGWDLEKDFKDEYGKLDYVNIHKD